jgi:hypothetical protein
MQNNLEAFLQEKLNKKRIRVISWRAVGDDFIDIYFWQGKKSNVYSEFFLTKDINSWVIERERVKIITEILEDDKI